MEVLKEYFLELPEEEQINLLKSLLDTIYLLDKAGKSKENVFEIFDYLYKIYNQKEKGGVI